MSTPHPSQPLNSRQRREDGSPSGWDRYLDLLMRERVPEKVRPWYVKRAKEFLKAMGSDILSHLTTEEVNDYFRKESASQRLNSWQFRQLVEAVQLLVIDLAHVRAGNSVDWDYWKVAVEALPLDHSTLAKEQSPEALLERRSGPRFARSAPEFPLLKTLARTLRAKHYSIRTEKSYVDWCHRFLLFCDGSVDEPLSSADVQRFLTHLSVERNVSSSTQSVALNAIAFLFKEVMGRELDALKFRRTKRPARMPVVLTREEVALLLGGMNGVYGLMTGLMYGTGMRLMECIGLRVGDVDFGHALIVVRNGKGGKDRVVPLPERYRDSLMELLKVVRVQHEEDLEVGAGSVFLPDALARKYPNAPKEWIWQYMFSST